MISADAVAGAKKRSSQRQSQRSLNVVVPAFGRLRPDRVVVKRSGDVAGHSEPVETSRIPRETYARTQIHQMSGRGFAGHARSQGAQNTANTRKSMISVVAKKPNK